MMNVYYKKQLLGEILKPDIDNYHLFGEWKFLNENVYSLFKKDLQELGQVSVSLNKDGTRTGTVEEESLEEIATEIEINLDVI